ncbi:MAG: hypothetical protein KIS90_15290 [Phenylobacterium sp.]|nr:hypothetical protein [Phenylobacterium sp.]
MIISAHAPGSGTPSMTRNDSEVRSCSAARPGPTKKAKNWFSPRVTRPS